VTAGNGYNFHFWNEGGRAPIDPTDVGGVFITAQARLIVGDRRKPDDRARARYVMSVGGDYWLNTTAPWDNFRTNGGIGGGRFKYVTSRWQAFNLITIPPNGVRQSPPPLE
jgi:hypothetical protein